MHAGNTPSPSPPARSAKRAIAPTPFFVGGCQKSGTTWVQRLLDAHPEVCCRGETHVADLLMPCLLEAAKAYNARQERRETSASLAIRLENTDVVTTGASLVQAIFARWLADPQVDPGLLKAIGDKTPENALSFSTLGRLFPRSRFIHVVRDGRDAAVSGWAHLQRLGDAGAGLDIEARFPHFSDYAEYFAEHHWARFIRAARASAASMPDRCIEVRYEDLYDEPAREAARLFRFLGATMLDDATIARCVEAASFERLSGGRSRGQTDIGSFFRKGVVGDWRSMFDDEALDRFERHAGELLELLHYGRARARV
jgi:hypothetical protein